MEEAIGDFVSKQSYSSFLLVYPKEELKSCRSDLLYGCLLSEQPKFLSHSIQVQKAK